ncbi:MAG: T9SS type A sorting domain-containing protein [Saprospiraceae bacterium]
MKKNPVIHLLFAALCWFISYLPSQAQFDSGATALTEAKMVDRAWHLSSKKDNNPLVRASGNILFGDNNTINGSSTFVIDDGPKDNKWWTSDIRWFHIKSQSTGQYLTVQGNVPGVAVTLAPLIEGEGGLIYPQQFRLVPTLQPGWYKLRSRMSQGGPDLVLEINASGQLVADSPNADPSEEQKFAFNLALPGGSRYGIISNSNRHFFSDNGILTEGTPAVHIKNANASVLWQFQAAGGGYYRIYNTLTKMYLALPAGGGSGSELIMTTSTGTNSHWQLIRNNNSFIIAHRSNAGLIINMNNNPGSGNPLYCTIGGVVGREWILSPLPNELTPASGNFERIADGALEITCAPVYGTIFKKGLIERVGLNPENTEPYFTFIREAIAAEAGAGQVDELLIRFDLNNPGHRVDLALMVRKYITEVLPLINRNTWSPETNQAVSEYEEKVRAVRLDHANRITAAWTAYSEQFATETMGFSQLIANIDAGGFVWPEIYQLQGTQADLTADYTVAANSFGYRNNAIVGSTFIGVSVALGASYVATTSALSSYLFGLAADGLIPLASAISTYNVVVNLAPPVAIGVIAATSIAVKAMEVSELQELLADINFQVAAASAPVSLNEIMSGLNLVDRTQLLSDLDYLIGAPVTNGFQFNTDDNFYQPPFSLNCLNNVTLSLDATGVATLTPAMCGSVSQSCGTAMQYFLTKSQFDCADLGVNEGIIFVVRNKVDENASDFYVQRCTLTVTVIDEIAPTITCPGNQTLALGANCSGVLPDYTGLATQVSDNCGQITVTQSPEAGTVVSDGGDMTVTLRVFAANGVTTTCTFTVTKVDNTPPLVVCPPTQTLELTSDCTATIPDYRLLSTTFDACGVSSVTQLAPPGFPVSGAGSITAILTATDANNNTSQCSFTITKVDNTLPVAQCFPQTLTFNGETQLVLNADDLVDASDHCGVASIDLSPSVITCAQIGQTVTVTATVTDINGNKSTCTSQVTVNGLPCGWIQNPNGVNCANGSNNTYNPANGVWTATSTNCYSTNFNSDAAAFAQRTLCGDGSITAQVTSISGAMGWAGIAMRESNDAGAKKAQLVTNLSSLNRQEFRTTTGGQAMPQQLASQNRFWLRIVRTGNQFSMYLSPNGQAWAFVGAQNIAMSACIQVGLVATNATGNSTVTATFTNVSITGGTIPLATPDAPATVNAAAPDFEAYPNPTTGEVTVDLKAYANQAVRLEVYDMQGKALKVIEVDAAETTTEQLDLSAYKNGIYLIRVQSDGLKDATKRVVLQGNDRP